MIYIPENIIHTVEQDDNGDIIYKKCGVHISDYISDLGSNYKSR